MVRSILIACAGVFFLQNVFSAPSAAPNVLVLNSYHPGYGWSDSEQDGLLNTLTTDYPFLQASIEYLDWRRFPLPERRASFLQSLTQKYGGKPFDLIISLDDPALDFALEYRKELGGTTPIVFGGVNYFTPAILRGQTNITGIAESKDLEGILNLILRLQPTARELAVIYDQNESALASLAALEAAIPRYSKQLKVRHISNWSEASLMKQLETLQPSNAAIFLSATVDRNGKLVSDDTNFVLSVKAHSRAPVYMVTQPLGPRYGSFDWEKAAWAGVGGCMLSGETHGKIVGAMAVRVLKGEKADFIPVQTTTPARLVVDYPEMLRFGLPISALPKGTEIVHRPQSYFEIHRTQILVTVAVAGMLSAVIVVLAANILQRRRAEAAMRQSNERFELIARTTNDAVCDWNPHSGEMWWNESAYTMLGVPRTTVPSYEAWVAFIHPDDRQRVVDDLKVAMKSGAQSWHAKYRFLRADGSAGTVFNRAIFLRGPSGRVVRVLGAMLDTTRENRLEEQVRFAQKMEAIGLLAGGVAHDFNNMLQVILGYTQFALDSNGDEADWRDCLNESRSAAERAVQLTRQLLVFGRRQPIQMQDVDLNRLVSDLLKMVRRLIGEHITVEFSLGDQLGNVRANPGHIEQVLMNLCVNARDAMPNGGRLSIELKNANLDSEFCESHPWAKPGQYVCMKVADNGCGMDEATLARAFDPFFSTKPKDKGTGLGLSVVYGIVQQHQGFINVESHLGVGTTFAIYLPDVKRDSATSDAGTAKPLPRGIGTVLLVEDEDAVRTLTTRVLTEAGYKVVTASNGVEAVEVFRSNASQISLLLLDAVMPKMGGREAYERISAIRPGVPVLFCTAYSTDLLEPGFSLGQGVQVIQKPFAPTDLLIRVHSLISASKGTS